MDLLNNAERNEARLAIKDVADTFHKIPVTYKVASVSLDRWQENRDKVGQIYVIPGRIEYGVRENDRFSAETSGDEDKATIQITFNVDDLTDLGLWDDVNNVARLNGASDEISFNGKSYRATTPPIYDGYLDRKPMLCLIYVDPNAPLT